MKVRTRWILVAGAAALGIAMFCALFAGLQAPPSPKAVTLEQVYALLVDKDGNNRLDAIEQQLADLDTELDLIYQHELKLIEEEAQRAEEHTWSNTDLMFFLQKLDSKLDQIIAHFP